MPKNVKINVDNDINLQQNNLGQV